MNLNQLENIRRILDKEIANHEVTGVTARVIYQGEDVFSYSNGYERVEEQKPMKADSIMRLFSMTKPITATAAMILYERGQLDLFASVDEYIPEFAGDKVFTPEKIVPAERKILVRDLLNMTSPICYPDGTPGNIPGNKMEELFDRKKKELREGIQTATVDLVCQASRLPMMFQPGDQWMYSFSADILGAVIERAAGKRFGAFLQDEIFKPLDMKDTGFYVPENKRNRFTDAYKYSADKERIELYQDNHLIVGDWTFAPEFESGGAGLVSTLNDYAKFTQMLVNGGTYENVRILGKNTVHFMGSNQLSEYQRRTADWDSMWGYGYGNLMRVLDCPSKSSTNGTIGEFGWDGWMGNHFFVDPEDDMIFLYFVQVADAPYFVKDRRMLRQIIYGSL